MKGEGEAARGLEGHCTFAPSAVECLVQQLAAADRVRAAVGHVMTAVVVSAVVVGGFGMHDPAAGVHSVRTTGGR